MRACAATTLDGEDRPRVVTVLMATFGSVKEWVKCLGQIRDKGSLSLLKGAFRDWERVRKRVE